MKTKLYFLFALIILVNCSTTIAQSNFAPVGATWHHSGFEGVYKSIAIKDTILLGKNCRQIKQRIFISWPGPVYREDLGSTRDLYIYSNPDTVFCLNDRINEFTPLFVFNVNAGDTINLPYFDPSSGCTKISDRDSPKFSFIIDSVKYINYDGELLKTVFSKVLRSKTPREISNFGWVSYFDSLNVYAEKLGSLKTGFLPNCIGKCLTLATVGCAAPRNLRCYEDDSIKIHFVDTCLNPSWVPASVVEKTTNTQKLNIFPNPTKDKITLGFEVINYQSKVIIVDVMGKKVLEKDFLKSFTLSIDVAELKAGVYFIKLLKEGEITIGSGSFVKL